MNNRTSLSLVSPAKLNLFLHILGKRKDGYHELQTVFQLLDYGDDMHFSLRDDSLISLEPTFSHIQPKDNLIIKAAEALRDVSNCTRGIDITIEKRLPIGGGIGGGSSNAATTLLALNHLWSTGLSVHELSKIGLALGADVPVFIQGKTAWAEGVGENLQPLELDEVWYCVLAPDCQVSTASVFSQKDLTRDTRPITIPAFLDQGGKNDCQPVVERLYPEVAEALSWLNRFSSAQMTGTGGCVFAQFPSRKEAIMVFDQRPNQFGGFVARGINHSPIVAQL